ncbi:hypothetical protein TSAR_002657 [Trichomalopsis sarcophagae]|uniref:Uncharacterized protein n=1 Tax=Trichomalopsis sarcophagae TaxID=543379 RepID=A0A232EIG1_9HYME|nr:hypothetical protein TSAR_002657 [Trichomalopsis sarcophagae]
MMVLTALKQVATAATNAVHSATGGGSSHHHPAATSGRSLQFKSPASRICRARREIFTFKSFVCWPGETSREVFRLSNSSLDSRCERITRAINRTALLFVYAEVG